jgi:hypothetical protein
MNERELDLIMVEVEGFMERLLAEYTANWVGDRRDENGEIYGQTGRQPGEVSGEVGGVGIGGIRR